MSTLHPPSIFGEQAVLDPWKGFAPATIRATSFCELLELPRSKISDAGLFVLKERVDALARRAPTYPTDEAVRLQAAASAKWKGFKAKVRAGIRKKRWAVDQRRIVEMPGGYSYILPANAVPGLPKRGAKKDGAKG